MEFTAVAISMNIYKEKRERDKKSTFKSVVNPRGNVMSFLSFFLAKIFCADF